MQQQVLSKEMIRFITPIGILKHKIKEQKIKRATKT